jgi:hypothetical protein
VVDVSVSKSTSAPAKSKVQPIPFNQYGSNIPQFEAFEDLPARPKSDINIDAGDRATPILLSEDDSPPPPNLMRLRSTRGLQLIVLRWVGKYDDII